MNSRNRSTWLWLGVLFCVVSGALFGLVLGVPNGKTFAGLLIGLATGFAVGIYGARKGAGQ